MRTSLQDRISWFSQVAALRPLLVRVLCSIDEVPSHFQVMAFGLTLHCVCRAAGINPHDILTKIQRMERDVDGPFSKEFRAMQEYVKGEFHDPY